MKTNADGKPPIFRRWLNVALRSFHLVAVIVLGAAMLGAPVPAGTAAAAVALTGVLMFAIDTWSHPVHLREFAGIAVLVKLLLVIWMALDASVRPLLFWVVVISSAVSSHAPARLRHKRLLGAVRAD